MRQLADADGEVTLAQNFKPFGGVLDSHGTGSTAYGYTGEWLDVYIKLIYLRSRYYAPETGRFLTRDTWQGDYTRPLSLNRWNYVEGNPINFTDPSGYCVAGDTACESIRDSIHAQFNFQVYIDIPDETYGECNPIFGADEPIPWSAQELGLVKDGLELLEQFWSSSSFIQLFTPVTIRRVYQATGGNAVMRPFDPIGRVTSPVIMMDSATFSATPFNAVFPIDSNAVIPMLWGELYHLMDFNLSGQPTSWENPSDADVGTICNFQSRYSTQFAYASGEWNVFECQAVFGKGLQYALGNDVVIDSPANLLANNYASLGPQEDFAHTFHLLTQALIGGEEHCTGGLVGLCLTSNVVSPKVRSFPGFWIDSNRLKFFIDTATIYGADISTRYKGFWE